MKFKKFWIILWILTFVSIFIVTLINNKPYILMGGSSSVSPVMEELMNMFPGNHKVGDFNYITSASSAAPPRVENGLFGIGWMSEDHDYKSNPSDVVQFTMMKDKIVILYNIPKEDLVNPNVPLNFTQQIMENLYIKHESWTVAFNDKDNKIFNSGINSLVVEPFTRPNGSGTRATFDKNCLGGNTFYKANVVDSSTAMLNLDPGSIGYTSYADYLQAAQHISTMGDWEKLSPPDQDYNLTRPFIGFINKNYKYIGQIIRFLKWLENSNSNLDNTFKKYGSKLIAFDDVKNQNNPFITWCHDKGLLPNPKNGEK